MNRMDVLFLGTGSGVPAKHRNVSSIALKLLDERNSVWLFDCGEATQQQILHTALKPRKIEKIFITHLHGDHIFGLPGFLSSRAFQGGNTPLWIYGPSGIKRFVQSALRYSYTTLRYPIHFVEIEEEGIIFQDQQFTVTCKLLNHGVPSYGYRIVEKDHPGTLQSDKLKELGVPFGPAFGKLKKGETVTLKDGRVLNGTDFIGAAHVGRIITILGDTKPCDASVALAKNADILIHESTFAGEDKKMAREYNHSTNIDAAETAKKACVKKVLLTHISARYLGADIKRMEKDARLVFPETFIMKDFQEVSIPLVKKN